MEKVLLTEERQSEVQRLLQKLKELRAGDEIYRIGIDKAQSDSGFEVMQNHTQKAITTLLLLFKELNVNESGIISVRKSATSNMTKFIESVEFALG